MEKNELMIVLAVVAFIVIVGIGVYKIVMPLVPEEKHEEKNKIAEAFELLLKSAGFMEGKTTYQFTTKEKTGDVEKTFFVTQNGENAYIKETLLGISREVFLQPNQSVLCFDFFGDRYCDLADDTREMMIVDGFRAALFSDERAEREKKRFEVLNHSLGLEIYSIEASAVDGKNCTLIKFKVNYTTLSVADLGSIGLSPSHPTVLLIPHQDVAYCVAEDGEVFSKQISYVYQGQQVEEGFVVVDSDYETSNIPPFPQNFTNLSLSFQRHYNIFNEYFTCLESNEKDKCIVSVAVHHLLPEMCEYATNKTTCYGAYVSFTLDPTICWKFEAQLRDDCFFTVASGKRDESFCGSISNETLKQDCITSLSYNQTTSNQTE
ncbi:MAG: hypothetical protein ACPL06_02845 [Candidatus Anstonellales archaeon]